MTDSDRKAEKKRLRMLMKSRRAELPLPEHREKSFHIMQRLMDLPEWQRSRTTHIYVSAINNEVDTLGLLFKMFDAGITVVVPRCDVNPSALRNVEIRSLDELELSRNCLMEPVYSAEREIATERFDLVVAPVVAFDRTGRRLGMGGGYYDQLLKRCGCPRIGLAFSFQEHEQVPVEPWDEALDLIITEQEVIRARRT